MRWLAFGTYDVARHPRVGVLIEGLRASGDQVTEVNEALALDTAARVAILRQPWRLPLLVAKLARCWTLLAVRSWRWRREPVDALLVGYLGHFDVWLARTLFPRALIVLDHLVSAAGTAIDRGLAGRDGAKARLMRAIDGGALRHADVIVVDTSEHAAALPPSSAARAVVAPVGAGQRWFAANAMGPSGGGAGAERARGALRAIFVGLFTPLHGTPALGAAIGALAGDDRIEFTLVGTGQDHAECRRLAAANCRVRWLDWVPSADLPALVASHDVALGIFGTTAKARMVVPNKVFQAAAAGCAIVTSDTAPQRRALGDSAVYVPAGDSAALAAALGELAGDAGRLGQLRYSAAKRAARRFTPLTIAQPVRERVSSLGAESSVGRVSSAGRARQGVPRRRGG